MKKIKIFLLLTVMILLTACQGLKTPEELIAPPEVDLEKKEIKDRVIEFLPAKYELVQIPISIDYKNTDAIFKTNLDSDNNEEIVALYRDDVDGKINVLVIEENDGDWRKKYEQKIDAYEISDYFVADCDADGSSEILIGIYNSSQSYKELVIIGNKSGKLDICYTTKYLALDIKNKVDNIVQIVISTAQNTLNNNKLVILNFKDGSVQKAGEYIYPHDAEIYRITYGNANENTKAYFVDMYMDINSGSTDILNFYGSNLDSIVKNTPSSRITQEIPFETQDINGDGILDVVKNAVLSRSENGETLTLSMGYNVDDDGRLKEVARFYDDRKNLIHIDILPEVENIVAKQEEKGVSLYFKSIEKDQEIKFFEALKIRGNELSEYDQDYIRAGSRNGEVLMVRLLDNDDLSGAEESEFDKLFYYMKDVSTVTGFLD